MFKRVIFVSFESVILRKTIVFMCLQLDVESDWSPIHDAAFNGCVLTLQRLIAQVKFSEIL